MFYNLTNRDGQATLSVVGAAINQSVASNHPNFSALLEYLTTTPDTEHDEQHVNRLLNPALFVSEALAEVTDRLVYAHNDLLFDGLPLNSILGRHILAKIENGDNDWERFVRFLINLDENPSYQAQQAVYRWIDRNGLTITPEGNFIGYKGVRSDGTSSSTGPNNYIDGVLLGEPGVSYHVPHEIGTVVSKKRAEVDDNRRLACSVGLHVGTEEYARGFAPRLLTVEVNPADVVSVPDNDLEYKIRVCRYKVVALADPQQFASTSWNPEEAAAEPTAEDLGLESMPEISVEEANAEVAASMADAQERYADDLEPTDEQMEAFEDALAEEPVVSAEHDTESAKPLTLAEHAEANPSLRADLEDKHLGHKPLAKKWSHLTTESSVRRYRKANGIKVTLATKIKG